MSKTTGLHKAGKKYYFTVYRNTLPFLKNNIAPSDDATLIRAYKSSGKLTVLATLYQPYMELVYAVCMKYLKEPEPAKDAVMDIFDVLINKVKEHEIQNFRSWLYVVARNHCLMQLRKRSGNKLVSLDENGMQFMDHLHHEEAVDKEWQFQLLSKCIEKLSGEQQKSISLFYLEQKCYKDIALLTGLDWNRVRSLIQNGRRNLKKCMEQ